MTLERPSMKQDWHPDHSMPEPEHDGESLGHTYESDRLSDNPDTGNAMLRERAVGQYNAKTYGKKK